VVNEPCWVIHLPTTLTSLDAAVELVTALRASLAHAPALDFGETTLSEEDHQSRRTRVWCDARIGGPGGPPASVPTTTPVPAASTCREPVDDRRASAQRRCPS
jgi:hypothetical protein